MSKCLSVLRARRRRLAGTERCLRVSQGQLNHSNSRMCAAEHAPRGLFRLLERIHGLAEITVCGCGVLVERPRVIPPQPERVFIIETVAAVSKGRKARMRSKVRLIYNECMATDAKLADCFLRDLSLAVRAPHREAALKAAESLRGPDCPSHDLDVAGDNPRYGWSVG